jgi:hypothetical protein
MIRDTLASIEKERDRFPNCFAESVPSQGEIETASSELGIAFNEDYIEFLTVFGGGIVGAYPIFGLRPVSVMGTARWSVLDVTNEYRQQTVPGVNSWIVFSEDHAGNPVGMDSDGVVWTHDHDFGGISRLYDNFESYITDQCLKRK